MNLHLQNKVFIVSGGGRGIGAAIVRTLAEEDAIPVILDRTETDAKPLVEDLRASGLRADFFLCELTSSERCAAVVQAIEQRYGRIDGLVNNAGTNDGASLARGIAAFEQSVQSNLFHYFYLAHACLPQLKAQRGSIVNISSKTALTGQGKTSGYAAAKGGILSLTREWAVELLPDGIRVNAIIPSEVYTPMYQNWLETHDEPTAKRAAIEAKIPLHQRMTTPQEIANTAVFLLSDRSSHTTGQWLFVDGGYVHLDRAI